MVYLVLIVIALAVIINYPQLLGFCLLLTVGYAFWRALYHYVAAIFWIWAAITLISILT